MNRKSQVLLIWNLIILFLYLFPNHFFAQEKITVKQSCVFDEEVTNQEFYIFTASREAEEKVETVVNAYHLSKNFEVKAADCKNVMAAVAGQQRYILYNTSFLENFNKDSRTRWAAYYMLAHEIGRHLNGHDFEVVDQDKCKEMKFQADKFAGAILFKLGATLNETKAGFNYIQSERENVTYLSTEARKMAIAEGWKFAAEYQENTSKKNPPDGDPSYSNGNSSGSSVDPVTSGGNYPGKSNKLGKVFDEHKNDPSMRNF